MTKKNALLLIGDKGTGKASFLNALKSNSPNNFDCPNGFETDSCFFVALSHVKIEGIEKKQKVDILLCFALNNSVSFINVQEKWKPDVERYLSERSLNCNLYLLGLKSDLKSGAQSLQEIGKCCAEIGALEYFECCSNDPKSCIQVLNVVQEYVSLKSSASTAVHPEALALPEKDGPTSSLEIKTLSTVKPVEEVLITPVKPVVDETFVPKVRVEDAVVPVLSSKTPAKVLPDPSSLLPAIPDTSLLPSISQNSLSLEEEFANFDFDKPLKPLPAPVTASPIAVETKELPNSTYRASTADKQKKSSVWGILFGKKPTRNSQYRESRTEQTLGNDPTSPLSQQTYSPPVTATPPKKKGFFARFFG